MKLRTIQIHVIEEVISQSSKKKIVAGLKINILIK